LDDSTRPHTQRPAVDNMARSASPTENAVRFSAPARTELAGKRAFQTPWAANDRRRLVLPKAELDVIGWMEPDVQDAGRVHFNCVDDKSVGSYEVCHPQLTRRPRERPCGPNRWRLAGRGFEDFEPCPQLGSLASTRTIVAQPPVQPLRCAPRQSRRRGPDGRGQDALGASSNRRAMSGRFFSASAKRSDTRCSTMAFTAS
jgi:hypothetical protein